MARGRESRRVPRARADRHRIDAPIDATPREVVHVVERAFTLDVTLVPAPIIDGAQTTLEIALSNLDADKRGHLQRGELRVRVVVRYFAGHDVIVESTLVVALDGRVQLTFVPRAGKYHVSVEPLARSESLGTAHFDLLAHAR